MVWAFGLGVLAPKDSKITSRMDLADKRILAWRHTTANAWVRKHLPKAKMLDTWPDNYEGSQAGVVLKEIVDAYVTDRSNLVVIARQQAGLRVLPKTLTKEDWGIAARKDNRDLLRRVNQALNVMDENGELKNLRTKWLKGSEKTRS